MIEFIQSEPEQCAPLLFESARRQAGFPASMTFDAYRKLVSEWRVFRLVDDTECCGFMSLVAYRIHLDILPARYAIWCQRGVIRRGLDIAFEGKPFLETIVRQDNTRATRLVEKIGFRQINAAAGYRHYLLLQKDRRF